MFSKILPVLLLLTACQKGVDTSAVKNAIGAVKSPETLPAERAACVGVIAASQASAHLLKSLDSLADSCQVQSLDFDLSACPAAEVAAPVAATEPAPEVVVQTSAVPAEVAAPTEVAAPAEVAAEPTKPADDALASLIAAIATPTDGLDSWQAAATTWVQDVGAALAADPAANSISVGTVLCQK